jgi:hypothetical protein
LIEFTIFLLPISLFNSSFDLIRHVDTHSECVILLIFYGNDYANAHQF